MADPEVKHPSAELFWHIAQKGWQMGAVIGLGIVAPIAVFRHRAAGLTLQAQLPRIMLALRNSAGVGTAAVCATITMFKAAHPHVFVTLRAALGAGRMSQLDADGIHDRAYRLRFNGGQVRTDKFAQVGTAIGAAGGAALAGLSATSLIGGAAAGTAIAVFAHVATSGKDAVPKQMIEEVKAIKDGV